MPIGTFYTIGTGPGGSRLYLIKWRQLLSPLAQTHRSLKANKTKQCTTGTGRGNRVYNLIRQGQRSRSTKAQSQRSLINKTHKTHDRHGPRGTSLLPHLVETTISLPQGTDPSHFNKTSQNSTRQARAVGDVAIVSFDRDNDPALPRHRAIAISQRKHRKHTTGTGRGGRRHCLIRSRQ